MRKSLRKLKDPVRRGQYLTRAIHKEDPAELQWCLYDVIKASGGLEEVAKRAELSEWRLKLMLSDAEEAWKLKRLEELIEAMGLKLVVIPKGRK